MFILAAKEMWTIIELFSYEFIFRNSICKTQRKDMRL